MNSPLISLFISAKAYTPKLLFWLFNFKTLLIAAVLRILAANQLLIFGIFALIFIDCITGVWAAKKRKEKIRISGRLLLSLSHKLIYYSLALIVGAVAEIALATTFIFYAIGSAVLLREFASNFENLDVIVGGTFFGDLFRTIKEKFIKTKS